MCTFSTSEGQKGSKPPVFDTFDFQTCFAPQRRAFFSTPGRPKVVRACGAFAILTWKCASRHNGVHFFDISTFESGPGLSVFYTVDLEMCFALQRRDLATSESGLTLVCFVTLTWKCASHHNGLHFFDISTSLKVLRS